ncbi:mitochondrial calcium uniporter regulator 1 isoform X5 [Opisthocomus hoazin]|uniref:mitochondrial calcium uniporter regulator 1 isoform X5 n=1 Tax=Opisthocomus hoazin TaxID=30419 RepID=UPI003F53C3C1
MARGPAATAVSGGRRALLLRAGGALPPAGAAAASREGRAPRSPAPRCLSGWQRPPAPPGSGAGSAGRGRPGGERSRCGERAVSISASSSLQSKGNVSLLGNRKLFFDTHALVCLLEENGFTTQQSEIIVSALVKIMNTNLDIIYKDMVTKVQQEIALQQVMSHIGGVKKDMIILEKSEFSALRSENEKIKLELQQIKKQVMHSKHPSTIKTRSSQNLLFQWMWSHKQPLHRNKHSCKSDEVWKLGNSSSSWGAWSSDLRAAVSCCDVLLS